MSAPPADLSDDVALRRHELARKGDSFLSATARAREDAPRQRRARLADAAGRERQAEERRRHREEQTRSAKTELERAFVVLRPHPWLTEEETAALTPEEASAVTEMILNETGPVTLALLGHVLGCSRERIRQVEEAACSKVRARLVRSGRSFASLASSRVTNGLADETCTTDFR